MNKIRLFIVLGLLAMVGGFFTRQHWLEAKQSEELFLPSFNMPDSQGVLHTSSEWQGKILIINFWATWCPPCRREIPDFVDLQRRFGGKGLQIIGVALDDQDAVDTYLKDVIVNYPILIGGDDAIELSEQLGNGVGAIPFTVIVSPAGRVVYSQLGEMAKEKIEKFIVLLTGV